MDQEIFDWILLLARWLHITVAVTWIGTSIFFMWLDRTLKKNPNSQNIGHVGELWMLHGGGFYHVEKHLMGPTKVPDHLHWFKWEAYWTWMSGAFLMTLIFYTGDGTFLLDSAVSNISYWQGVSLGIFSLIGSWFFYDFLWERTLTKNNPLIGHLFTLLWLIGITYVLCHTLSGRAAYMHIGGMLGTWMTANVFMRIIPRQLKMVEAARKNEAVNQEWGQNAKNRSTHNTYFTLPVIFIMLSNHFPATYGHEYNWLILLVLCAAGAAIREYFVKRIDNPARSMKFLILGLAILISVISFSRTNNSAPQKTTTQIHKHIESPVELVPVVSTEKIDASIETNISGIISFEGSPPKGKKLNLPIGCSENAKGDAYSNEILVKNGKIQNVLVRITKGLEGKTFTDIPTKTIELDQRGCLYSPRVIATRVGQKVDFINSDNLFHNIRSVTQNNKSFNIPMPKKDQRVTMVFDKPEIFLQSKCSVHPWMGAYIAVVDHPFFSVTNDKGEFNITNLPPGSYTLEIWHEVFGTQTKELTIKNNDKLNLNFSFKSGGK
ncbi:MAG: urate hydroxylase PuuD [Bacteriovorax sp.]|nr:urate hydroxylase PuuD [Bacteriovorax sp.]